MALFFFFNDTATTEIYTLSLHDALPIFAQATQDFQQLAAGHPARLRRAGAGCVSRVEHVDVDGDVERAVADAPAQRVDGLVDPAAQHVAGGDAAETEPAVLFEIALAVQRAAGADVRQRARVEDALLRRPPERGAVGERLAEVGVPGVE